MSTTDHTTPAAALAHKAQVAAAFRRLVSERTLAVTIRGREHIRVEGWTLLAEMEGYTVGTADVAPVTYGEHHGWQASALMRTADGVVIASASSVCMDDEARWRGADSYALCGMAQTRAVGRVVRQALGHVVEMAGYATTPAEEMPTSETPAVETITIGQVHSLVHLADACDLSPAQAGAIVMRVAGVAQASDIPMRALAEVERAFLATRPGTGARGGDGEPPIDAPEQVA